MALNATALFNDRLTAHAAIEQLVQAGFSRDVISVAMSDSTHDREFAFRSGVRSTVGGQACGGVLASIVSCLVAVSDGILAAGPLAAGLAAERGSWSELLRAGAILVGVTTSHVRAELARQVLELAGGEALAA